MTNSAVDDSYPSWSPDSTELIFISSRDDLQDIYTMSATDGSGLTRLTATPWADTDPTWH
jgi:Tol biopolymer transport system component